MRGGGEGRRGEWTGVGQPAAIPPLDEFLALALAYERGRAQNAQLTYDAIQNAQKNGRAPEARDAAADAVEIPITAPERTINGVRINASTEFIRISTR